MTSPKRNKQKEIYEKKKDDPMSKIYVQTFPHRQRSTGELLRLIYLFTGNEVGRIRPQFLRFDIAMMSRPPSQNTSCQVE
jgi:hypothetical protein